MNKNTGKYLILFVKQYYIWGAIAIFALYLAFTIIKAPSMSGKIFFFIVGIFILIGATYYEYLKKLYQKMIIAQTQDVNPTLAKQYQSKLQKLDIFRGFKGSFILFDTLCLFDQQQYDKCLKHLAANERFFKAKLDYLFIFYYYQLLCYYFLDESDKALMMIDKLKQFQSMKQKNLSPLFSFSQIEGIHYILNGRIQKGIKILENTDISYFNTREKIIHYQIIIKVAKKIANTSLIKKYTKTLRKLTEGEENEAF